jgi:hypothetical protein
MPYGAKTRCSGDYVDIVISTNKRTGGESWPPQIARSGSRPINHAKRVRVWRKIKLPFSRIDDFGQRSQIRWHIQVACLSLSVLFANRIQPVRPVR